MKDIDDLKELTSKYTKKYEEQYQNLIKRLSVSAEAGKSDAVIFDVTGELEDEKTLLRLKREGFQVEKIIGMDLRGVYKISWK